MRTNIRVVALICFVLPIITVIISYIASIKLNLVEAESFLRESGIFETETTRIGEQIAVSGIKRLRGNAIYRRGINFLDKQATSYIDVIASNIPCHSCVIDKLFENMPDDEITNGVYNKQIKCS